MGIYLNPGNEGFKEAVGSRIYVDKTGLLDYTNRSLGTKQRFMCVSRPRRFGKSMAAGMLAETQLPVTEVALSCGFKEVSLFDRQFGAAYGCPPLQYRRQSRAEDQV